VLYSLGHKLTPIKNFFPSTRGGLLLTKSTHTHTHTARVLLASKSKHILRQSCWQLKGIM